MRPALRHPPAFSITLNPDPAWRALGCLLSGLAAAGLTAVSVQHLRPLLPLAALVGAALLGAVAGVLLTRQLACPDYRYCLRWDGEAWWLGSAEIAEQPVSLSAALDLEDWLLLQARRPGWPQAWHPLYLPVSAAAARPHWRDLRATLFAATPT